MKNVTFLGVEGSGKTVLTLALVNAFRAHAAEGWYLRPDSREAFRFLSQMPQTVDASNLPHQTTSLKHLAWSVQLNGKTQRNLDVLDYPGEIYRLAFLQAKDDPNPATFEQRVAANKEDIDAMFSHLANSEQVFVLFNLADAKDVAKNGMNLDAVWVTNACLDYLHRLPHHPSITLLLTQIDRYADLAEYELDPEVFVEHHMPLVHHNFPDLDVVAVSVFNPTQKTFGLDGILLRCLYECESVEPVIRELKDLSSRANELLKRDFRRNSHDWIGELERDINQCVALSARLPWFVPRDQLLSNGLRVDSSVNAEVLSLIQILKGINWEQDLPVLEASIRVAHRAISDFMPKTKEGAQVREGALGELSKCFSECTKAQTRHDKFEQALVGVIWLLAACAVVEIVVIFTRMAL